MQAFSRTFSIAGQDFSKGGSASLEIKEILREMGVDPALVRRVAIAAYEGPEATGELTPQLRALPSQLHLVAEALSQCGLLLQSTIGWFLVSAGGRDGHEP